MAISGVQYLRGWKGVQNDAPKFEHYKARAFAHFVSYFR